MEKTKKRREERERKEEKISTYVIRRVYLRVTSGLERVSTILTEFDRSRSSFDAFTHFILFYIVDDTVDSSDDPRDRGTFFCMSCTITRLRRDALLVT